MALLRFRKQVRILCLLCVLLIVLVYHIVLIKSTTLYEQIRYIFAQTPYLRALSSTVVERYIIEIRFSSTRFSTKIAQFSFSFSRYKFFDIIFYNLDVCDSPVTAGVSFFFLRPPVFLGAGVSVVFDAVFLLAVFFFVDFFSGSAVSAGALLC